MDDDGGLLSVSRFGRKVWRPSLAAAGIEHRKLHRLRATAASLMLRAGGSLEFIRRQLGHADIATTQRYLASFLGDEDGVIANMDALMREPFRPHRDHADEGEESEARL